MDDKQQLVKTTEVANYDTIPRSPTTAEVESQNGQGIEPFHIMLITVIGSFGIAFSTAPILVSSETLCNLQFAIVPEIGHILCSLIIFAISSAFVAWYLKEKAKTSFEQSIKELLKDRLKRLPELIKIFVLYVFEECPALLQILVFGIGSILVCILKIVEHESGMTIELLQNSCRLASLILQIFFFALFIDVNAKHLQLPFWYHGTMPVLICAQIWLLVTDIVEPLWPEDDNLEADSEDNEHFSNVYLFMKHSAEPYQEEFTTIAIALLYDIWMEMRNANTKVSSEDLGEKENFGKLDKDEPQKKSDSVEVVEMHESEKTLKWHMLASFLWSLSYIIITTVLLHTKNLADEYSQFERVSIFRGIQTLYYGILLSGIAIYALRQLRICSSSHYSSVNVSQCVLVLTGLVVLIFYALRVMAAAFELKNDRNTDSANSTIMICLYPASIVNPSSDNATITSEQKLLMDSILFIYPVLSVLQIWTQTQLLLEAQQRHVQQRVVHICLVYIIGLNFADWMQTGIDLGFYRDKSVTYSSTPILGKFFSKTTAQAMRLVIYPFIVLYRFHASVIAWEIIISGHKRKDSVEDKGIKTQIKIDEDDNIV